jgi:5-methylcytosine-specific restriction protein A
MAARSKTSWRKVGCGKLVDAPSYCEKHAKQSFGWVRSNGDKSSTQRGHGYNWQQRRERILQRDYSRCQIKEPACSFVASEVDHVVRKAAARADGWTNERIEADSNPQAASSAGHKAKTQAERGGGSRFFGAIRT